MSVTSWFLVSGGGTRHRLPREMIFVGRDDCELMLQSRSVDKQHAVINYELVSDEHKVKDLGSLNGTFVNDVRIQDQTYITLKMDDKLRFGYDTNLFTVVRGEMHVPEEALKHEKFTSQLQLCKTPPNGEAAKTSAKTSKPASAKTPESKAAKPITASPSKAADTHKGDDKTAGDIAALHRGTPLYGQPSWWGDGDADDENSFKQETKTSGKKQENESREGKRAERERERDRAKQPKQNGLAPGAPVGVAAATADAGYLELPSKDKGMSNSSIHEIPTKDTEGSAAAANAHHPSGASNASQGHASFTIEFDTASPGRVTIKDHRGGGRSAGKKSGQAGLGTLQSAMMASETKVADWLAQNDPPMVRRESAEEDSKTIKSDVPVHFRRLKGSKHEDGTQSDSENGLGHHRLGSGRHRQQQQQQAALEERLRAVAASASQSASARSKAGSGDGQSPSSSSRTAFMIEFYDEDNPRKRRSYSFSQTAPLLPGVGGGPTSAVSTEHLSPAPPPTRPSHKAGSTGGGIGIGVGMATEGNGKGGSGSSPSPLALVAPTAARLLQKQREEQQQQQLQLQQQQMQQQMGVSGNNVPSSTRSSAPTGKSASPTEESHTKQEGDDHSDKGTYTIELENRNPEEEEARRMIDKVFGLEAGQERPGGGPQKTEGKASDSKKPSSKTTEVIIDEQVAVGSPHWVSQWASHAANHTRTDPEGSGAEPSAFVHQEREAEAFDSTLSQRSTGSTPSSLTQERKRRTLPQLPADDKAKLGSKAALGALGLGLGLRSEIGEKQDTEPQEKENHNGGGDVHSLVEGKPVGVVTANGVAAVILESKEGGRKRRGGGGGTGSGQEGRGSGSDTGEKSGGRPLVRQGSFTIDRPSGAVPTELIPIIGRGDGSGVAPPTATKGRERSDSAGSMDTATLLKDTEAVMAFLEAKLRDEGVRQDKRGM